MLVVALLQPLGDESGLPASSDWSSMPIDALLRAFDRLDADACAALLTEHGRLRYGHWLPPL